MSFWEKETLSQFLLLFHAVGVQALPCGSKNIVSVVRIDSWKHFNPSLCLFLTECFYMCVYKGATVFCLLEGINVSPELCMLNGGFIDKPFLTTSALDSAAPSLQTMEWKSSTLEALHLSQLKSEPITHLFTQPMLPLSKKSKHAISNAPGCLSAFASYRSE